MLLFDFLNLYGYFLVNLTIFIFIWFVRSFVYFTLQKSYIKLCISNIINNSKSNKIALTN